MAQCIFCRTIEGPFKTREHILPESLGGGDWAILPKGLFCDACQNRFGSTIEQQALADYPFSLLRVILGIPTKQGKAPWMNSFEGILEAGPCPGTLGYDPAPPFRKSTESKQKSVMRILAEPQKPTFICRMLLKMGLELIAADNPRDIFHQKFDAARQFALKGNKDEKWWYLQREDMATVPVYIKKGVKKLKWGDDVFLDTIVVGEANNQAEVFHLKLLYLDFFVPLEPQIGPPPMAEFKEPEYRLFYV